MKKKKYVNIESETDSFGIETPKKINWQDGTVYLIERVIHIIRKKSDLIEYTVLIYGQQKKLFREKERWFVETEL